ncbi:MAG: rRNA pseudouridine synthase [Bacteroidetes bacterium]|nr:rRNA pseudouridine synthase [Bacteroidota bacterium]
MSDEAISLARALSKLGYCSRSRAALYVKSGRVTVNGRVIKSPAWRVDTGKDSIEVDERRLVKPTAVVIMLHKPAGFITTSSDDLSRRTVYELVPGDLHLFAVGRLDLDTTGLLLFTNSGELQDRITSPEKEVVKTYVVTANGKVTSDHIDKLLRGVEIREGVVAKADECEIIESEFSRTRLRIRIHEGKNRQIRRMFDALGKSVITLHRSAIGKLELDLPEGGWRKLCDEEVEAIFR